MEKFLIIVTLAIVLCSCAVAEEPEYTTATQDKIYSLDSRGESSLLLGRMGDTGELAWAVDNGCSCEILGYIPHWRLQEDVVLRLIAPSGVNLLYLSEQEFSCEWDEEEFLIGGTHESWRAEIVLETESASIFGPPGNGNSFRATLIAYGNGEGQILSAGPEIEDTIIFSFYEDMFVNLPIKQQLPRVETRGGNIIVWSTGGFIYGSPGEDNIFLMGRGAVHSYEGNDKVECSPGTRCYCDCGEGDDSAIGCETQINCDP